MKSHDDEEKSLKYFWQKVDSFDNYAKVRFNSASDPVATFIAPIVDEDTPFIFQLTVNNGKKTDRDTIKVTVKADKINTSNYSTTKTSADDDVTVQIDHTVNDQIHCMPECFEPNPIIVDVDTIVNFTNTNGGNHAIFQGNPSDALPGLFRSDIMLLNEPFSYTFTESGIYHYFCAVHTGARGTVIVK